MQLRTCLSAARFASFQRLLKRAPGRAFYIIFLNSFSISLRSLCQAYGVHMNGYTEKDGEKSLWIGKRSDMKQTYPGMLDHIVAGGLVSFLFPVFFYSSLLKLHSTF